MKTNYFASVILIAIVISCSDQRENLSQESNGKASNQEDLTQEGEKVDTMNNQGDLVVEDKLKSLASIPAPPKPPERYPLLEPDPFGPIGSAVDIYFDDMRPVFEDDTFKVKIIPPVPVDDYIYEIVDIEAKYHGGVNELMKFIIDNFQYPQEYDGSGKVYIRFAIMKTGAVENIKVLKGVSEAVDNEAKRVIALMPNWIPAENNGEIVNSWVTIPISFHPSK